MIGGFRLNRRAISFWWALWSWPGKVEGRELWPRSKVITSSVVGGTSVDLTFYPLLPPLRLAGTQT